jgi:hypothetical protein
MSQKAQRWLCEQEIALLQFLYDLPSPAESQDAPIKRKERHKVRPADSTADGSR